MDDLARFNKARWEELAAAHVDYSRPALTLDPASARQMVDPHGVMGEVQGKRVLCLAAGGGQQSVAFALLGANVTVLDLSETQLERDQAALDHYGLHATLIQGDMRDMSRFESASFDLVWQAFSINFIPEPAPIFDAVRRILRPGGLYHLEWHNPFTTNVIYESWNGQGYLIKQRYLDGEMTFSDPYWDVTGLDGVRRRIEGPREFNHRLSTILNGLIERDFTLLGLWEFAGTEAAAEPGSWEHFLQVVAPYLTVWAGFADRI